MLWNYGGSLADFVRMCNIVVIVRRDQACQTEKWEFVVRNIL